MDTKAPGARFTGKVAVVTGSSRGIGRAVATRLLMEGAAVVINGRKPEDLSKTATDLREIGNERVLAVAGNVTEVSTAPALMEAAISKFGGIDFIVSNVGISPYFGRLMKANRAAFEKTMISNTWPSVALVQEARRVGLGRRGGAVVNISSIGSRQVAPVLATYAASKAALEFLTRALARELGPRGIRVNAVAPGFIMTELATVFLEGDKGQREAEILPLGRLGQPEDVAAATCFLLSDDASWITGVTLDVDGGRLLVGGEPRDLYGVYDEDI
jgi:3-oxoacyl-[acyl-carrier protein] reductase